MILSLLPLLPFDFLIFSPHSPYYLQAHKLSKVLHPPHCKDAIKQSTTLVFQVAIALSFLPLARGGPNRSSDLRSLNSVGPLVRVARSAQYNQGGQGGGVAPSGGYGAAASGACRTEYKQECQTVNEQECNTVQERQCRTVQRQSCNTVNEQQCSTVQEQQCNTVNEQVSDSLD